MLKLWWKKNQKAIWAFIGLVVTNLTQRVTSGEAPLPDFTDWKGWLVLIGSTVVFTAIVWARENLPWWSQVEKYLRANGMTAVPEKPAA